MTTITEKKECPNCNGAGTVQVDLFGTAEICMECYGSGETND